jgi:hypothetical protein
MYLFLCPTELISCSEAVKLELFSSYSPCIKCCKLIERFLQLRPQCKISIAFTCVYLHYDQQHRSALRGLCKNTSVIQLDVFGEKEWKVLQAMELVALTPAQYSQMRHWDEYWRNILEDIMRWFRETSATVWVSQVCIINEGFYSRYVCDVMRSGRQVRTFRRNYLSSSSG